MALSRTGIALAAITLAIAASALLAPRTPAQGASSQNYPGRFSMLTPPAGSPRNTPDFVWVLDSATGEVRAYQLGQADDGYWTQGKIMTITEYTDWKREQAAGKP